MSSNMLLTTHVVSARLAGRPDAPAHEVMRLCGCIWKPVGHIYSIVWQIFNHGAGELRLYARHILCIWFACDVQSRQGHC